MRIEWCCAKLLYEIVIHGSYSLVGGSYNMHDLTTKHNPYEQVRFCKFCGTKIEIVEKQNGKQSDENE